MRAFGESLDTRSVSEMRQIPPNDFPEKALNFLTPHQKWGIHSTYSENLLMRRSLAVDRLSGSAKPMPEN